MIWRCATYEFDTRMPIVMGILNVTPDSFSDGGQHDGFDAALAHAERMAEEGARIIDVGGESTRPGAAPVSVDEELARVLPVVRALAQRDVCVSIDTRHAEVARACLEAGAAIVNDVSGFRDPAMVDAVRDSDCGLVVMHMQGDPSTMQNAPSYDDVVADVREWLRDRAAALEAAGVAHDRICIDPGPGFGKTPSQTLELVRNFQEFVRLGYPVMVAVSRKSFLGWAYGIDEPSARDEVSAAEALMACELGASVVRAHNVAATVAALEGLRPYALIGMGCNVPLVASSFYESEPAYYLDQDSFVNAVVLLRTGIPPKELLGYLHAVENSLGRVREVRNGPRTCDLDILDYQLYVVDADVLTLPHPRLLERDFVVQPLLELLPGHVLANDVPVSVDGVTVGKSVRL